MTRFRGSRRALLAALFGMGVLSAGPVPVLAEENGRLTTHVLDTANGKPAGGMTIDFYRLEGETYRLVSTVQTNKDGRTDKPLAVGEAFAVGRYQIVFHVAEYYGKLGTALAEPAFLDRVPVQFSIADGKAHYHVPLLTTPWSYATYRGS